MQASDCHSVDNDDDAIHPSAERKKVRPTLCEWVGVKLENVSDT